MQVVPFNEEMYVLVAPDGTPQVGTLQYTFKECCAICTMLSAVDIAKPLDQLFKEGFNILPVKITVVPNGDESKAFNVDKEFHPPMSFDDDEVYRETKY